MPRAYFYPAAARHLGVTEEWVRRLVGLGKLRPDGRFGRRPWFWRATLDAYKRGIEARRADLHYDARGGRLYTTGQAARLLGVTRQAVSARKLHPDLRTPDGRPLYLARTLGR